MFTLFSHCVLIFLSQGKYRARRTCIAGTAVTAPAIECVLNSTLSTATPTHAAWAMPVSVLRLECIAWITGSESRHHIFKRMWLQTEQTVTRTMPWAARKDLFAEKITAINSIFWATARVSCPQRTVASVSLFYRECCANIM